MTYASDDQPDPPAPECPCRDGPGWQQVHVTGCCRCRCTMCLARQEALAKERDRGGCYRCAQCRVRATPEGGGWTFIPMRHPRAGARLLPVCERCWYIDLAA